MKTIESVLIVDDSSADTFLAQHFLSLSEGIVRVASESDPELVLAAFERPSEGAARYPGCFPPAVILLDINMPKINGFELLKKLTQLDTLPNSVVVVMLTSSSYDGDLARAQKYSLVKHHATKPLTKEVVDDLVERFGS